MPLLLHGGSREYNRFFSYDWSGGWVSQGVGKQHATTAAAALHAFQVLAKESRKSQSKTTCAIRLCTAWISRNTMTREMKYLLLDMLCGCVCFSNFVSIYELCGRQRKDRDRKDEPEGPKEDEQQTSNNYHTISSGVDDSFVALIVQALVYGAIYKATNGQEEKTLSVLRLLEAPFIEEIEVRKKEYSELFWRVPINRGGKRKGYDMKYVRPNTKTILKLANEIGGIQNEQLVSLLHRAMELCVVFEMLSKSKTKSKDSFESAYEYSDGNSMLMEFVRNEE